MNTFPKNFKHIGIIEFTLESGEDADNIVLQEMILLFNSNYLTAEEALTTLENDECSDYVIIMTKSAFNGVFKNVGFNHGSYGILS